MFTSLSAETLIELEGYLGKDQFAQANKKLDQLSQDPLVIRIKTLSGDLDQTLQFSKKMFLLKEQKKAKIIVYMDESVIGPGAIIPFLADDLYSTSFVSWGDILYGVEQGMPDNILINRLQSMIPSSHPHAALLNALAEAMIDKHSGLDEQGRLVKKELERGSEATIINQRDLKLWGLVNKTFEWSDFQKEFLKSIPNQVAIPASVSEIQKFEKYIPYQHQGKNTIGWIVIDDRQSGINQGTALYVKSALDYYKKKKPLFIVLELNTPGGEVFAAQKISDALKEMDTQFNVPIVAYINNWAISAGAMLAYSCRFITVVKDGSMGAAEPVLAQQTGEMKEASEKVNSALRTDFANRAGFFDRNPYIAEAMVDKDLILVQRHGEIIKLDNEDQIRMKGPDPDKIISKKGKLLTLNSEQLLEYKVADLLVPPVKVDFLSSEERKKGAWPAKASQLFHASFFKDIPNAEVDEYQMDWKTKFFVFLAHPIVSSMLFLGLMLGLYLEISNPGLTLPGTVAILSLFFIVLSSFSQEIGNILEVILLFTGLAILLIEIFVLPTFGLLGIAGILFFLAGLFGLMLPGVGSIDFEIDTQTWNAAGEAFFERLGLLSLTIIIGTLLIAMMSRYMMPSLSLWNRFILQGNEQDAQEGYVAGPDQKTFPKNGAEGEVAATLRPAGKIRVNDEIYDAMSSGGFIEKGEKIRVVGIDSSTLIVQKKEDT